VEFNNKTADFFVPDGIESKDALARTTHICVGAHQDDIEIMAYHGIAECFGRHDQWMSGVVVTNGAGSPRTGIYGNHTDEKMQTVRRCEQRKAAYLGEYGAQIQLDYSSSQVKKDAVEFVIDDLEKIFRTAQSRVVYLHNPADKHETHIAVLIRALTALRRLPEDSMPEKVYGCEVWRNLDWLMDEDKEKLSVSKYPNLAASLVGIFDSQISGGKRYDLATAGRRLANATYYDSHASDDESAMTYAVDLTTLVRNSDLSLSEYTRNYIDGFRDDVEERIERLI